MFIGAVLAANIAGLPAKTVNLLAASYLFSRVVYNVTYVWLQDNRDFAPLRTVAFQAGVASWITLYVKAGLSILKADQ